MENNFDIIKVMANDDLAWVESAEELAAARLRVWQLLVDSPGEYIVFNQLSKTLVAHFSIHEAPQVPEWWRQEDSYVKLPQPAVAAAADDEGFDEDFADYLPVLQPLVA
jgi:hypothetical protein